MDFDLFFDEDRISNFLLNKLEEIKAKNEKLSLTLHDRRQILSGMRESCNTEMDESNIKISTQAWKKIFNNKYVLGITIQNNGSRCLCNLRAVLKWNSPCPLSYQVFLYEEINVPSLDNLTSPTFICNKENCNGITNSLKKSEEVDKLAHLIVTIKQPRFIDQLSYNLGGNLIFQQDGRDITLIFPTVEISAIDTTTHSLHNFSLANGDIRDIAMAISSSEESNLIMIFPQGWSNAFDSTVEILCSLSKINTRASCRKLFVAHRLSPSFDGSVLIFHAPKEANVQTYNFTIYTRNEDSLFHLLHHLHQNIPGVLIIPETLYENYIQQHPEFISAERETSKLKDCIKREIDFVKTIIHESQDAKIAENNNDVHRKFADIEKRTNLHYLRLLKTIGELSN